MAATQKTQIKNKYSRGIIELKKVILVSNSMFFSMIYSLVHLKNAHIVHMTWQKSSHDLKSNMATTKNDQNDKQG